jgi:F-type H+-transporting ATPase subunit delta
MSSGLLMQPYARALFSWADANQAISETYQTLKDLIEACRETNFDQYIQHPRWSAQQKMLLIDQLPLAPALKKLLYIMLKNNRWSSISNLFKAYEKLYLAHANILPIQIQSAFPLADLTKISLEKHLSQRLKKKIQASYQLVPELMGGVLIKFGDYVWDTTIKNQWHQCRSQLLGYQQR